MSNETITLGDNFNPPVVCGDIAKEVYDVVRTDEFDVAVFNGLLMAIVVYLDTHSADYNDGGLPWAEEFNSTQ